MAMLRCSSTAELLSIRGAWRSWRLGAAFLPNSFIMMKDNPSDQFPFSFGPVSYQHSGGGEESVVSAQRGIFGERRKWVSPSYGIHGDVSPVCLLLIHVQLYCIMWISFLSCSNSEHFADLKTGTSCCVVQCNRPLMWEPLGTTLMEY